MVNGIQYVESEGFNTSLTPTAHIKGPVNLFAYCFLHNATQMHITLCSTSFRLRTKHCTAKYVDKQENLVTQFLLIHKSTHIYN